MILINSEQLTDSEFIYYVNYRKHINSRYQSIVINHSIRRLYNGSIDKYQKLNNVMEIHTQFNSLFIAQTMYI